MRIYRDCFQAKSEVEREVAEMGKEVKLHTYQDKNIEGNPDFFTKELLCYSYMIHEPKDKQSLLANRKPEEIAWAVQEFEDRLGERNLNPGLAWNLRENIWKQFMDAEGKFSYTYSERIGSQVKKVIEMLKVNPHSRNAIVSIWDRQIDQDRIGGKLRVPCSMYYQALIRDGKLHLIYNMRSSDVMTHWVFDVYLAIALQEYLAEQLEVEIGDFYHQLGSFHAYAKDLKGIF